jgi:hypothetical protein
VFAALAFVIVIIMESILPLFAFATAEISHNTVCHVFAERTLGVISVVVPPASCIPIFILLPVLEA